MAVVQTGSLLSFSITWLVHITRMGSLAGFLDNSKSLLCNESGLGLARHFRVALQTRICFDVVGSSVGYLLEKSAR